MAIIFEGNAKGSFNKLTNHVMDKLKQSERETANVIYYDLDRVIYSYKEIEYTIRIWNIEQNGNVDYTVFERREGKAEPIYNGYFIYDVA